jgi:transcriptional accessory protein Tex/SPT6
MQLLGVVRNIVAFGAFIDVGVDTDGSSSALRLCLFKFYEALAVLA